MCLAAYRHIDIAALRLVSSTRANTSRSMSCAGMISNAPTQLINASMRPQKSIHSENTDLHCSSIIASNTIRCTLEEPGNSVTTFSSPAASISNRDRRQPLDANSPAMAEPNAPAAPAMATTRSSTLNSARKGYFTTRRKEIGRARVGIFGQSMNRCKTATCFADISRRLQIKRK